MIARVRALGGLRAYRDAALLGLATIGAYGVAQYSIGVLVAPIASDTGWSGGAIAAAFAVGVLLSGPAAVVAGALLDRAGSRPVLLPALLIGGALLAASSWATTAAPFVLAWGLGGAVIAGGLYYPMTMAATSRLYPERRATALSVLTLLGALASPIFYPLAGALLTSLGWREAVRLLVVAMVVFVLPAALLVHAPAAPAAPAIDATPSAPSASSRSRREALRSAVAAVRDPPVLRLLVAIALVSGGTSALLLHQVPAMQAAGLSLAGASALAGMRGMLQIPGRLVLAPVVRVLGLHGSTTVAYALGVLGAAALWAALAGGPALPLAWGFVIAAGLFVGLLSPLHGLLAAETYGEARLGTISGVQQLIASTAGAAGAWLAGIATDATGGYATSVAAMAVVLAAGVVAIRWQRAAVRVRA